MMTMKKVKLLILTIFSFLAFGSLAFALDLYTDSISTDNQINGTGWWGGTPYGSTSVNWQITNFGAYIHYKYTFTHTEHDASHFIIEVPVDFTDTDLTTDLVYMINTYPDISQSYQGMPGSVYGIKFESFTSYTDHGDGTYTETIEFDSTRLPGWGDFYARAGVHPSSPEGHGAWDAAWNAGFLVSENTPNYDLNDGMHIAVPFEELPEDSDGDGVLDDGDYSGTPGDNPCTPGAAAGCDDNCPDDVNPLQEDSDGDGIGDACEVEPTPVPTLSEWGIIIFMTLMMGTGVMIIRKRRMV
jgi:hypothetical protein